MTFQLTEAIESIQLGDTEKFKECLNEHIEQVYKQKLNEEISPYEDTKIITEIMLSVQQFGGEAEYDDGVFDCSFRKKEAVFDFCDFLDATDAVYSYDVFVYEQYDGATVETDVDIEDIEDDTAFDFVVLVYLSEEAALYDVEYEDDLSLNEVRRRFKVNSQGKKRIKMQCRKGFKWNGTSCVKIAGAELANQRISKRKMAITKRSQGAALKIRVARKSKKAKRFRKAFGLREDTVSTGNVAGADLPLGKKLDEALYALVDNKGNVITRVHDKDEKSAWDTIIKQGKGRKDTHKLVMLREASEH